MIFIKAFLKSFVKFYQAFFARKTQEVLSESIDKQMNKKTKISQQNVVINNSDNVLLTVGINNFKRNQRISLRGCVNDATEMAKLFSENNYKVIVLTDEQATAENIINQLKKLSSYSLNSFVFHRSSHGTQITDTNSDEKDGLDEAFVAYDCMFGGLIADDTTYELVNRIDAKVKIVITDTCHSFSAERLVSSDIFTMSPDEADKSMIINRSVDKSEFTGVKPQDFNVIITEKTPTFFHISGCKDDSTSADYYDEKAKKFHGALTKALLDTLKGNQKGTRIDAIYQQAFKLVKDAGFEQEIGYTAPQNVDIPSFF